MIFPAVMNRFNDINLSTPQHQTDWDQYYALRWQLLRKEWHQPLGSERDEYESDAFHVMATNSTGIVIGVGRLHKLDSTAAQIRFMAVKEDQQRLGIGSKLLTALETQATVWELESITLNARDSHLAFYRKHHYEAIEPSDTLFDVIKHTKMRKFIRTQ